MKVRRKKHAQTTIEGKRTTREKSGKMKEEMDMEVRDVRER